jgi:hypothetical protein
VTGGNSFISLFRLTNNGGTSSAVLVSTMTATGDIRLSGSFVAA